MVPALEEKPEDSSQVMQHSPQAIVKKVPNIHTSEHAPSPTERYTCMEDGKSEKSSFPKESVEVLPCNLSAVPFDDLGEDSNNDFSKASHYDLGESSLSDLGEDSNDNFSKARHSDFGGASHYDLGEDSLSDLEEDSNDDFGTASHTMFHMDRYRARHMGQTSVLNKTVTAKPVQLAVS
uniref:Uncharacterized protein n=1 Tax=Branchiostoma floridae TaxID=7739 RepID=C3XXK5_BRAFL|eukprot:XP_002611455.1 hypothetical protein BRAFLDRAFT_117214 [Branchiostoma floridae]